MSKAFTRESDDLPERPARRRAASTLPPGTKNYLTPDGAQRLRAFLEHLSAQERPRVLATGASAELAALDERIAHLEESLASAVIVPPAPGPVEQVRFGVTVTVRNRSGAETRYRIVGVDEMDLDRNWVSWRSPIARALLNARLGDRIRFKFPAGEEELEITRLVREEG